METAPATKPYQPVLLILIVFVIIFAIVAQVLAQTRGFLVNDDFFTFYLSAHMIVRGEDPYSMEQWVNYHDLFGADWIPNQIFPYPLPLAFFLAPLGWLSLSQASVVWVFFAQVLVLVTALLEISFWRVSRLTPYIFPALAGIFLFRPTLVAIRNGQIGPYLLMCIALVAYLWEKEKWLLGGIVLSFLFMKPGFGLPVIGILFLWLLARHQAQGYFGIILGVLGILLVGWFYDPGWILKFLWIGGQKLNYSLGYSPTVWGMAGAVCKHNYACTISAGATVSFFLLIFCLYLLIRKWRWADPLIAVSSVLPVVVLITPYMWAYDQLLLLPSLLLIMGQMAEKKIPYIIVSMFPLFVSVISIMFVVLAMYAGHDGWSALVSLLTMGLMIVLIKERRYSYQ